MTALNSFSVASDLFDFNPEIIESFDYGRTFETKGIFIIPYDTNRLVAFVRASIDVLHTVNESRTLWSNPELSFYGYCHIRNYKASVGNPVQVNQRYQTLFSWFPQESLTQLSLGQMYFNTLSELSAEVLPPVKAYLPSPFITDLSFGFQRPGRYFVTVTIGYFKIGAFPRPDIFDVQQSIPNPIDVETTDPSSYKDLGYPDATLSPPYLPGNDDYGESDSSPDVPDDLPTVVPFRIRYSFQTPAGETFTELTIQYSGPAPISISTNPSRVGTVFAATIVYEGGTSYLPYRSSFATPEQETSFLSTFQFIEYVYE